MRAPVRAVTASRPGLLGVARILFGMLVLLRTTPVLLPLGIPYLVGTYPFLGWPAQTWHVAMLGGLWPDAVVKALCVARTLAILLFTLGVRAREAGVAAGVLAWAVMSQDAGSYINTFHLLYVGMVVLGASGAGSSRALHREREVDLASGLALTRALVVSVYAWSGYAKLNAQWLRGDVLESLCASRAVRGPIADALLTSPGAFAATAWLVVATELALGPLLLWRRTRRAALVLALTFHAVLEISMHPDFFGFAMAILLLAFVEPAWLGSLRGGVRGWDRGGGADEGGARAGLARGRAEVVALLPRALAGEALPVVEVGEPSRIEARRGRGRADARIGARVDVARDDRRSG